MRSVALTAAILVTGALRDEIGRFDLEVWSGQPSGSRKKSWWLVMGTKGYGGFGRVPGGGFS